MTTSKLEIYQNALKQAGLRLTAPRQAICAYLAETESHPTPYQVFEELSQSHPDISRATVYNTLNTLQRLGVIVELSFGADHAHYDTNPLPHVNLICLRCHRITDLEAEKPLEALDTLLGGERGFHALVARAEVLGLCEGCFAATKHAAEQRFGELPATAATSLHQTESVPPMSVAGHKQQHRKGVHS